MDGDVYTLHIDAYTPDTIPMARLAEYMAAFAALLGEKERVHFTGLETGSTRLLSRVESVAVPKVRDHVARASSGDAAQWKHLNEMLRSDNAVGTLSRGEANILLFPGRRTVRPPKMGPFNEPVSLDGVLVRIGGRDKSAHAIIESTTGETWSFDVTRELARQLAPHLFGSPLRLIGQGRWVRTEEGAWEHTQLRATSFEVLSSDSLLEVVTRLRDASVWKENVDALGLVQSLRDDENGVH